MDFGLKPIKLKPINIKPIKIKPIKLKTLQIFGKSFRETGHDFELRVRRDLKKKGYKVSKAKNRHNDWHAERGGGTYLVECKCNTARLSPRQEDFFAKMLKQGKNYILARKTKTGRIEYKRH